MKCPVCTLGGVAANAEQCPQCSADLVIHRLLEEVSRSVTSTPTQSSIASPAPDLRALQVPVTPSPTIPWPAWLPWLIGGQIVVSLLLIGAVLSQALLIRELHQTRSTQAAVAHEPKAAQDERATDIARALAGMLQDTLHLYEREREERIALTRKLEAPPTPVAQNPGSGPGSVLPNIPGTAELPASPTAPFTAHH